MKEIKFVDIKERAFLLSDLSKAIDYYFEDVQTGLINSADELYDYIFNKMCERTNKKN